MERSPGRLWKTTVSDPNNLLQSVGHGLDEDCNLLGLDVGRVDVLIEREGFGDGRERRSALREDQRDYQSVSQSEDRGEEMEKRT